MKPVQRSSNNRIKDLKDGSVFKQSEFFQENPEAYSIILYSDAVEIKVTPEVKIKFSLWSVLAFTSDPESSQQIVILLEVSSRM